MLHAVYLGGGVSYCCGKSFRKRNSSSAHLCLPRAALHMSVSNTVQHVAVAYILVNWLILKGVWDTDGMKCINCAALPIHDFKSCTYVRTISIKQWRV